MKTLALIIVTTCWITTCAFAGSIKLSKHNLSYGSLVGNIKSNETSRICIFCHTTHKGDPRAPLWNREIGKVVYTLYDSSTLYSVPGQPDGASKLCLSCHDGTVALGRVLHRKKEFVMLKTNMGRMPRGKRSNIGSDLSDDHPVSFDPTAAVSTSAELMRPSPKEDVRYDENGKVQCTTCHNPHDNLHGHFMVKSNRNAGVCKTCHDMSGFNGFSSHDTASDTWNGQGENPWPHTHFQTVAENSCLNCHRNHGAAGKERLLSSSLEENVCFACHDGSVAKDIKSDFYKISKHNIISYQGVHDPTEDIKTAAKHVECVDCHNPHAVNNLTAAAPNINGRLKNVPGTTISGSRVKQSLYEYEVCLKCHGEDSYHIPSPADRMFPGTANIRTAFQPTNVSYHPVAARGKNSTGNYTLLPNFMPASSRIYCTHCHNSDSAAKGAHGSAYDYLLERQYITTDYAQWSEANYALCYKCHNPISLFDDNAGGFFKHEKHVRGENTPCSVCHDPHGSPRYIGLLNFDLNVVFPNGIGELKFEVLGNKGYCYLQCHGKEHTPNYYDRR